MIAYEMRISDWSSDVCSSDLNGIGAHAGEQAEEDFRQTEAGLSFSDDDIERHQRFEPAAQRVALGQANVDNVHVVAMPDLVDDFDAEVAILQQLCTFPPLNAFSEHLQIAAQVEHPRRSEEHTSELQSLMRISYAVFCLKKK